MKASAAQDSNDEVCLKWAYKSKLIGIFPKNDELIVFFLEKKMKRGERSINFKMWRGKSFFCEINEDSLYL